MAAGDDDATAARAGDEAAFAAAWDGGLAVPDEDKPDIREVLEALGRLPLNQRAALVMRELEGRTYAEIADTLGVSVPAVETLERRRVTRIYGPKHEAPVCQREAQGRCEREAVVSAALDEAGPDTERYQPIAAHMDAD